MPKHSPCINVCRMDADSGFCFGCARTKEEIALRRDASPSILEQVWAELPQRRARLGIELRRLALSPSEVVSFIRDTLRLGGGTWTMGCYGAVAEFCVGVEEAVSFQESESHVVAETARGAIRLQVGPQVYVLALAAGDASARRELVVLAVPRSRQQLSAPAGLRALGPDRESIKISSRGDLLCDLGVGIGLTQFCIRTSDRSLAQNLEENAGRDWSEALRVLGPSILEVSPDRVVCGPLGRIEVFTPIPPPGGRSPDGPHTHLLPAHLAARLETPPGLQVPEAFIVGAIFYPAAGPTDSCA